MSTFLFDEIFPTQTLGVGSFWIAVFTLALVVCSLSLTLLLTFIYAQTQRPIMILATLVGTTTALFLASPATATDPIANSTLNQDLLLAPNFVTREALLKNSDWFFDFADCPYSTFDPGSVCNADKATWPLLTNHQLTVSQLRIGPCSVIPAHIHRADNVVVAVAGTTRTFMYPEDGGQTVEQHLSPGQLTLFPRAGLHTMVNEDCTNNLLYSFLTSSDAGRLTVLSPHAFWSFGINLTHPALPILPVTQETYAATVRELPAVGTGVIYGLAECRARCGLPPTTDGGGVGGNGSYERVAPGNGRAAGRARA